MFSYLCESIFAIIFMLGFYQYPVITEIKNGIWHKNSINYASNMDFGPIRIEKHQV